MLKEGVVAFKKKLDYYGDRFVIDSYTLKDGTYRLIYMTDDDWRMENPVDIHYDRKNKIMVGETDKDFYFIKRLDYYSKLIEMNKPIDPKKQIHTCNYLSLACKKDKIAQGAITPSIISIFYAVLRDPMAKYAKKKQSRELYEMTEKRVGPVNIELLDQIEAFVLTHDIWEGMDLTQKNYAKVFFVFEDENQTIALYQQEANRYLLPNVFNKNDYNEYMGESIYGLPGDNLALNSKKPYLEHRTKKASVPHLISQSEAILQRQFFDYLQGEAAKHKFNVIVENDDISTYADADLPSDIEPGATFYRTRIGGKGELIIIRELKINEKRRRLDPYICIEDYLELPLKAKEPFPYDRNIEDIWELFNNIDQILYNRGLKSNLFSDAKDIKMSELGLKKEILRTRDMWVSWIYGGSVSGFASMFNRTGLRLISSSLAQGKLFIAKHQFNLWISILEYLKGKKAGGTKQMLTEIRNRLWENINLDGYTDWQIVSDEEYAYAVGQLVSYFLTLSRANDKNCSVINAFVDASDSQTINARLIRLYRKYSYAVSKVTSKANRVGELLSHVLDYSTNQISKEYLIAGFMSAALIYKKTDEEENEG